MVNTKAWMVPTKKIKKASKRKRDALEEEDRKFALELQRRDEDERSGNGNALSLIVHLLGATRAAPAERPPLLLPSEEEAKAEPKDDSLPDGSMCLVCCKRANSTTIMDCGHKICCAKCARKLLLGPEATRTCPLCRIDIVYGAKVIKVFT